MKAPKIEGKYSVSSSIEIQASKENVWEVISDFANPKDWAPSVKDSYAITKNERGIGAGRYCKLEEFGEIKEFITLWEEGTGYVYNVTPIGPLGVSNSSWWLEVIDENTTRLSVKLAYNTRFGLFGTIMHVLMMRAKIQASLPSTLNALKLNIEDRNVLPKIITRASNPAKNGSHAAA